MRRIQCLLLCLWAAASTCRAAQWFVSTNGTGNGTLANPWPLQTALTNSVIQPGDTVWLRGGTYFPTATFPSSGSTRLCWWQTVAGSSGNPVTYRSYTNEWAAIDRIWGNVTSYVLFRDLEFYDSLKGYNLTNNMYPHGPWLHFSVSPGNETTWINCVIHDIDNGWSSSAGWWSSGQVRGCIFWYVGWSVWEHVCYPAPAVFSGNISGWNSQNVINNTVANLVCSGNIMFGGGELESQNSSTDIQISAGYNNVISGNCSYRRLTDGTPGLALAGEADGSTVMTITGNLFAAPSPVALVGGSGGTINLVGNTVYASSTNFAGAVLQFTMGGTAWVCDSNSYFCTPGTVNSPNASVRFLDSQTYDTLAQWQAATGLDSHSTASSSSVPADSVTVIPNQDQPKRCNIAICNWSRQNSVTVNLSSILSAGDSYSLYSVQNYNGGAVSGPSPIQTGTFNGTSIVVPMTGLTVAPVLYGTNTSPDGSQIVQPPPTSPEFGAFVVIGSAAARPAPPTNLQGVPGP